MSNPFRIALTADLHFGSRVHSGDLATFRLIAHLAKNPPDLLVLAGDVGAGDHFEKCLALFDQFSCPKAVVPGNHDVWVTLTDCAAIHLTFIATISLVFVPSMAFTISIGSR